MTHLEKIEKEVDDLWREKIKIRNFLPPLFPKIVCLCGSTKFMEAFYDANMRETLAGRIVLSVGMSSKGDCKPNEEQKRGLDELHLRKIDLADEVLILNCKLPHCGECGVVFDSYTSPEMSKLTCYKCGAGPGKICVMKPYIGESTRRELAYARSRGKVIRFLESGHE